MTTTSFPDRNENLLANSGRPRSEKRPPKSAFQPSKARSPADRRGPQSQHGDGPSGKRRRVSIWRDLARSLQFPLRPESLFSIGVLSVCYAFFIGPLWMFRLAPLMMYGRAAVFYLLFLLIAFGYLAFFLLQILRTAASGENDLPIASEWDWDGILQGVGLMFGAFLAGFGPLIVWGAFSGGTDAGAWFGLALAVFAVVYTPMAVLSVALHDSVFGVAPWVVGRAIWITRRRYALACAVGTLALVLALGLGILVSVIPFVGSILSWWIMLHGGATVMHMLGTVYRRHRKRLNWGVE